MPSGLSAMQDTLPSVKKINLRMHNIHSHIEPEVVPTQQMSDSVPDILTSKVLHPDLCGSDT
jgi:hypothetical protein